MIANKNMRIERNLRIAATLIAVPAILLSLAASFPKLGSLPSLIIGEEVLKPIAFFCLISAVILSQSHFVSFGQNEGAPQRVPQWLGACVDVLLLLIIGFFTYTYLHEAIVEKPELFPDWLLMDIDPMERLLSGPPAWVLVSALLVVGACLYLNIKVWGLPLVIVAICAASYAVLASLSSRFGWAPDNTFLNYPLAANDPGSELRKYLVIGDAHSLLGTFTSILLRIVLPFVILGSLFSATGGGKSLIKLAFQMTKNTKGGPAHGAIVASSLFGTISGGPVVNVLATGVLTIPMMLNQKFKSTFAGGVEAAASSGGQIVPPVMGVAAFFLANFTGVPYSSVIVAAIIPAVLYYVCLVMTVSLEADKLGMKPMGDLLEEYQMKSQDWANLIIIFVPILVIITVLASEAFTVAAAGIFALLTLIPLSFIDPNVRKNPFILLSSFSDGAITAGKILLLFTAVAIVDSSLSAIGFPNSFGAFIASLTKGGVSVFGYELSGNLYLLLVLAMTMVAALILGMGMPTLPAYANVAIVMASGLTGLGLSVFTANMFVFYFAVASAITPPVAVAAFAAASITKADPMRTSFAAVRLGLVLFLIPFVFAFYPELLLIEDAFIADRVSGDLIAMRPNGFEWLTFWSILARVLLAIYLLSSAIARFDRRNLSGVEVTLRLGLAVGCLCTPVIVHMPSVGLSLMLLFFGGRTLKSIGKR